MVHLMLGLTAAEEEIAVSEEEESPDLHDSHEDLRDSHEDIRQRFLSVDSQADSREGRLHGGSPGGSPGGGASFRYLPLMSVVSHSCQLLGLISHWRCLASYSRLISVVSQLLLHIGLMLSQF